MLYFTRLFTPNPLKNGFRQPHIPVPLFAAEPDPLLQFQKSGMAELGADHLLTGFLRLGRTNLDFPAYPLLPGGLGQCHLY